MKVSKPVSSKIIKKLASRRGKATHISDLLDLGNRARIEKSLSRLVKQGIVKRIGRGLYEYPRMSVLLDQPALQSPLELLEAWAKKNKLRVMPSGAQAANLLRLSTQVPAKMVYLTNGKTRTIKLGPYTIHLVNRGPKTMDTTGKIFPVLVEALKYLGKNGMTGEVQMRLESFVNPKVQAEVRANLDMAPGWMKPILESLLRKREKNG